MKGKEDCADAGDAPFSFPNAGKTDFFDGGDGNQYGTCDDHPPQGNGNGGNVRAEPDKDGGK